jgi:6-phosphogluconolactonase
MGSPDIRVVEDLAKAFASEVASAFATRPGKRFSLVCSGGPTARQCYEELAHAERSDVDWGLVDVYMGDERCVPAEDPEANQRLVRESLLDRVGRYGSFHPMSCDDGPDLYSQLVKDAGEFDLAHMGMGPTATPPRSSRTDPSWTRARKSWCCSHPTRADRTGSRV